MDAIIVILSVIVLVICAYAWYHIIRSFIVEVFRIGKKISAQSEALQATQSFESNRLDFRVAGKNANACSACGRMYSEIDSCSYCRPEKMSCFGGYIHKFSRDCHCSHCIERRRQS